MTSPWRSASTLVRAEVDPATGATWLSTGSRLANLYADQGQCGGLSALLFGDSITAANEGPGPYTADEYTMFDGWFTAFQIVAGQTLTSVWNAAKGGDTTAMMVARLAADVTPYRADYGIFLGGTNDFGLDVGTLASTKANTLLILAAMRDRVDQLVIIPMLPRNTVPAGRLADFLAFNAWLRVIAPQFNARIADIGRSIVNTSSGSWDMQSQYARDAGGVRLHPNDLGAQVLGAALARYFPELRSIGRSSPMDGSNLLANGELAGTTTPTSWNVFGTVSAHTRTARPDGEPGIFYGVTTTDFVNATQTVSSGFTVGERYCFEFEFIGAPAGVSSVYGLASMSGGAQFTGNKNIGTVTGSVPASGVIRTPDFVVPVGTTSITCFMYFGGAGTYKMARPYLRKLS